MYICLDCGAEFVAPSCHTERTDDPPLPFAEYYGCPHCGGEFTEKHVCAFCCESIREDHIRLVDGTYVCASCYEKISVP